MPIRLTLEADSKTLFIHVSGKLVKADYEHFLPEFERLVSEHGQMRALFDVTDLRGWDSGALWEEIKFDFKHFRDFERLAVIGDRKWEEVMTFLCKPFTHAALCYFDEEHLEEARKWLNIRHGKEPR